MTGSEAIGAASGPASTPVWDPLVRFGHWALVAAFAVAYVSGEGEADALHVWGGYVVGTIVVLRVVWSFVGPRHARFSDFVRSPIVAAAYFRDLLYGRARRYIGHSPVGGAMVIALLACLAATVATGLVAYGEEKGPLAAVLVSDAKANGKKPGTGLSRSGAARKRKALSANCIACSLMSPWRSWSRTFSGWRSPVSCTKKILCWR